jgi:hypothetical protein
MYTDICIYLHIYIVFGEEEDLVDEVFTCETDS